MKIQKNKTILGLAFASILLAPAIVFAINRIININNTFALTYSIPDGYTTFNDTNLYDCVANQYKDDHPNDDISEGLTDEQLQQMTYLACNDKEITDATGIETMTALTHLELYTNKLTSITLPSSNTLTHLDLSHNQLTSIDVSNNTALEYLSLGANKLTDINVSNNTALTQLGLYDNQLSSVDVSDNTALTSLYLYDNQLSSIDVSNNTALEYLSLHDNQLSSVDVSNNTALTQLGLSNNQLSSIDVSNNTALTDLRLDNNQLSSIDVSNNTALTLLWLSNNQLSSIDVSNNRSLIGLSLYDNQLTSIDIFQNTDLNNLEIDENVLITAKTLIQEGGENYIYDFSNLKFMEDGERSNYNDSSLSYNLTFSIQNTNYMTYDKPNMLLTVMNPTATNGYVQVVGKEENNAISLLFLGNFFYFVVLTLICNLCGIYLYGRLR